MEGDIVARETKEQMRERLENEIRELKDQRNQAWEENQDLKRKLYAQEDQIEEQFKQTSLYKQMIKEIEQLKIIKAIDERAIKNFETDKTKLIDRLEQLQKLINEQPKVVHNARGAGRKQKFNDAEIEEIKAMYAKGKSMRAIANYMGCSAGLICKLVNNKKNI